MLVMMEKKLGRRIKRSKQDTLFSNYIRERDSWTCQRCGAKKNPDDPNARKGLHCSHYIGRGKYATRFSDDNCEALCYGCHQILTANPKMHVEHKISKLGKARIEELELEANTNTRRKRMFENEDEYQKIKQKLENLKEHHLEGKNGDW